METLEQQVLELIETREDLVVLLNTAGVIIHSSQSWSDYCRKKQLNDKFWKTGENYIEGLEMNENLKEIHYVKDILEGEAAEYIRISSFQLTDTVDHFLIKYHPFLLGDGKYGVILYKDSLPYLPVDLLNSEAILESMTDAFCLLDNQMNFLYSNSKVESFLNLAKEELLGRNIWTVFPQLVGTDFFINCNYALQKHISTQFEAHYSPFGYGFTISVNPIECGGLALCFQQLNKHHIAKEETLTYTHIDYLTGWANRRKFEEQLKQVIDNKIPFSLFYVNLDNFNHVNTLYTHNIGDQVFKSIAENLKKLLSPQEIAGRLDGDELILMHLHQKPEEIIDFSNKVQQIFTNAIIVDDALSVAVSASIGVSSYPQDSSDAEELISFAEIAMREAKKYPDSPAFFFQSDMRTGLTRRLVIERGLSGDLETSGFHFAIQPQINCLNGELAGLEVLSRWKHPKLGMISPFEFISIAEETGTISRLTHHLLNKIFSFMNQHSDQCSKFPKTAINITPSLLTSATFFEDLFFLMTKYSIPPESIEIEITECVELTLSEVTLKNLLSCQTKGISIALDDFGTGFSTLAYLMEFPIDKIKLDKSFVTKIGNDIKSEAVLKSLIEFINNIDCKIVAEGVELVSQADFLKKSGCFIHQGYLYDRPMPPETFVRKYLLKYSGRNEKTG